MKKILKFLSRQWLWLAMGAALCFLLFVYMVFFVVLKSLIGIEDAEIMTVVFIIVSMVTYYVIRRIHN